MLELELEQLSGPISAETGRDGPRSQGLLLEPSPAAGGVGEPAVLKAFPEVPYRVPSRSP